jgi:NAD(P)-dependent dehydrogenase (short-subunit alcohol dehydrogenase family)
MIPAYSMSKTAVNGLTKELAAELEPDGILVAGVNPGWVKTEMGGAGAKLSIEEGCETALYLATAAREDIQTGRNYHRQEVLDW